MRMVAGEYVHRQKTTELGLDPDALDLATWEALAGALRRVARFLCPCSEATLVRAVVEPLRGLVRSLDAQALQDRAREALQCIVAYGDLHEVRPLEEGVAIGPALLYAAPPSFVARDSGTVLLLGVGGDHLSPLPDYLKCRIQYRGHVRWLQPSQPGEGLRGILQQLGLCEVSEKTWLSSPPRVTAKEAVDVANRSFDAVGPSGSISGLRLLDPTKSVNHYKERWVDAKAQTGNFVARRDQAYGAPLWCYVSLVDGQPQKMIDFPLGGNRWRGCDEAWRLQMAIDKQRGGPQQFRVTEGGDKALLEFFSPLPAWAQRKLDAVGEYVKRRGSLFGYRIPSAEIHQEKRFLQEELWMVQEQRGRR